MGDYPFVPPELKADNRSSAANASNYYFSNFGKTGQVLMVVGMGLSLGLSIGAIIIVTLGRITDREAAREARAAIEARLVDMVQASEKRNMDYAGIAKQEARIAQDKVDRIEVGLGKRGININTDGH